MGRKNWLFSKNGKGARANVIYQSLIMNAEVNSLRPWKYLERLLAEIKELEEPIEEGGCYLPWSEKVQEKCNIGSVCTEKINTTSKKQPECKSFEKSDSIQAVWCIYYFVYNY